MNDFSIPADPLLYNRMPMTTLPIPQYNFARQKNMEQRLEDYKSYMTDYTGELEHKLPMIPNNPHH